METIERDRPASARERQREPQREPWRRRLIRTLLYGRNVDRAAKARARIGLAILVFALWAIRSLRHGS